MKLNSPTARLILATSAVVTVMAASVGAKAQSAPSPSNLPPDVATTLTAPTIAQTVDECLTSAKADYQQVKGKTGASFDTVLGKANVGQNVQCSFARNGDGNVVSFTVFDTSGGKTADLANGAVKITAKSMLDNNMKPSVNVGAKLSVPNEKSDFSLQSIPTDTGAAAAASQAVKAKVSPKSGL